MKRLIQLTGVFVFLGLFAFYANASDLSDITGNKNEIAIRYLHENNIITGYADNTFQPFKILNRAELIKILVGGSGAQPTLSEYHHCFPDVRNEWYAPYICYAKKQGWVEGYFDGSFQPAKDVSKPEAIKMLVKSQGYSLPIMTADAIYEDVINTEWYAPFIKAAKDKGLLEETSVLFGVKEPMQRGAISENIYRAMILKREGLNNFYDWSEAVKSTQDTSPSQALEPPVPEPTPTPLAPTSSGMCQSNRYNCTDFSSKSAAQSLFETCLAETGRDIHDLDRDSDGLACESL